MNRFWGDLAVGQAVSGELLEQPAPGSVVSLNRAAAVAMVAGHSAGPDLLRELESGHRWRVTTGCMRPGRTCWRCPATSGCG